MRNLSLCFFKHTVVFAGLMLVLGLPLADAAEYCFGAVGQGCGMAAGGPFGSVATCLPNFSGTAKDVTCQVSGGSMTHDPCCVRNPYGEFCGNTPATTQCHAEWDRAVNRFLWGYQWKRKVNSKKENTTGNVVRADYCAPNGKGIHRNDRSLCCSGRSAQASFLDRIGRPSLYVCIE